MINPILAMGCIAKSSIFLFLTFSTFYSVVYSLSDDIICFGDLPPGGPSGLYPFYTRDGRQYGVWDFTDINDLCWANPTLNFSGYCNYESYVRQEPGKDAEEVLLRKPGFFPLGGIFYRGFSDFLQWCEARCLCLDKYREISQRISEGPGSAGVPINLEGILNRLAREDGRIPEEVFDLDLHGDMYSITASSSTGEGLGRPTLPLNRNAQILNNPSRLHNYDGDYRRLTTFPPYRQRAPDEGTSAEHRGIRQPEDLPSPRPRRSPSLRRPDYAFSQDCAEQILPAAIADAQELENMPQATPAINPFDIDGQSIAGATQLPSQRRRRRSRLVEILFGCFRPSFD